MKYCFYKLKWILIVYLLISYQLTTTIDKFVILFPMVIINIMSVSILLVLRLPQFIAKLVITPNYCWRNRDGFTGFDCNVQFIEGHPLWSKTLVSNVLIIKDSMGGLLWRFSTDVADYENTANTALNDKSHSYELASQKLNQIKWQLMPCFLIHVFLNGCHFE